MRLLQIIYFILRVIIAVIFIFYDFEVLQLHGKVWTKYIFYLEILGPYFTFTLLLNIIEFIIARFYRRRKRILLARTDNFLLGLGHISSILLTIGSIGAFLAFFDVSVKEFITSISIVAAALSILFKEYIGNILNGMIITFSNQLSIEDYVKIGEHRGKIIDITLQNIHLWNDDDDLVYIPNNYFFNNITLNYTKGDNHKATVDFDINYAYMSSIAEMEEDLIRNLESFREHLVPDTYLLRTIDIKEDQVHLKFQFMLNSYDRKIERLIRRHIERYIVGLVSQQANLMVKPLVHKK